MRARRRRRSGGRRRPACQQASRDRRRRGPCGGRRSHGRGWRAWRAARSPAAAHRESLGFVEDRGDLLFVFVPVLRLRRQRQPRSGRSQSGRRVRPWRRRRQPGHGGDGGRRRRPALGGGRRQGPDRTGRWRGQRSDRACRRRRKWLQRSAQGSRLRRPGGSRQRPHSQQGLGPTWPRRRGFGQRAKPSVLFVLVSYAWQGLQLLTER
jgi:hypothetical protein